MFNLSLSTKIAAACAGLITAGAVGLALASPASASTGNSFTQAENAYLNAITADGFVVYDSAWSVSTGYLICSKFAYMNGDQIARDLYSHSGIGDHQTLHSAHLMVNDAANTLCPEVWNSGSIPRQN